MGMEYTKKDFYKFTIASFIFQKEKSFVQSNGIIYTS